MRVCWVAVVFIAQLGCGGRTSLLFGPGRDAAPEAGALADARVDQGAGDLPVTWPDLTAPDQASADLPPPKPWVVTAATPGFSAHVVGEGVATDSVGNAHVVGTYMGKATFGTTLVDFAGIRDVFAVKVSPAGAFAWITADGGTGSEWGRAIAVASDGGVVIAGEYSQLLGFGPGTIGPLGGYVDLFVARLSPAGTIQWVQALGGLAYENVRAVAVDATGNIFLAAVFSSSMTVAGATHTAKGDPDLIVIKLSPAGQALWAVSAGSTGYDRIGGVAADGAGGCVFGGTFTGQATLGGKTIQGGCVVRLDSDGAVLWIAAPTGTVSVDDLARDKAGNVHVAGSYGGTASFGGVSLTAPAVGTDHTYAARLAPGGGFIWASWVGRSNMVVFQGLSAHPRRIALDAAGNSYVAGIFGQSVPYGFTTLTSAGGRDIVVVKVGPGGKLLWAVGAGGPQDDTCGGVASDPAGNLFVTGGFVGQAVFGTQTVVAQGYEDLFLWRIPAPGL
ncbi:hypothetical protein KJ682_13890 [bacterium]|nr:hypothetical protein [bacterium]